MLLEQSYIDHLITCPKLISKPPKKLFQETGANRRNDLEVETLDHQEQFSIFLRQNNILPDNFSLGLIWKSHELNKDIIIFRCNGPHGGNLKIKEHFKQHIHKISAEDINNQHYKPSSIEVTSEYVSFDQAIAFFMLYCNIKDAHIYFPSITSQSLFSEL